MTLWIVLTVLTSAAAVLVSAPFLRRFDERRATREASTSVYLDQLQEVEREEATGLIEPEQAALAKAEIKRRLLVADREAAPAASGPALSPNVAVLGLAGFVVLGSVTLYALTGRPDVPASAPATRSFSQPAAPSAVKPIQLAADPAPQPASAGLAPVDEMITRLAKRLEAKPGDPDGWRMLGWSYLHTGHYDEAVKAYAKAIALRPDNAGFQASYGEAMVRAANETVTPEAKAAFEQALKFDSKEPRARYFLGLALEQQGAKAAALDAWTALLKEAGPSDDWAEELRQRVTSLAKELGSSADPRASTETAALPSPPPPAERGPTAADVKAAGSMSAEDRNTMIRGMVDRLASRLAQSPQDLDGWIKLIRARTVLGEQEAAKEAPPHPPSPGGTCARPCVPLHACLLRYLAYAPGPGADALRGSR
jgi:cytochrome c-type biogenesis protein CcmH